MVAKSYQSFEIVSDVYTVNGRKYVKVRNGKGSVQQVRWYTDKEYARMYGTKAVDSTKDPYWKSQKEVLGFKEGYITIFKGDTFSVKEELKSAGARYTRFWGWGIPGGSEIPEIEGIEPMRLDWSAVGKEDETLKSDEEVQSAVDALVCEPSSSEFQGKIGERIHGILMKVTRSFQIDSYYGQSTVHNFEDEDGNVYTWITASKSLPEGGVYWIDGTIKDHKVYKNVKQTVLTRCKAVEEVV